MPKFRVHYQGFVDIAVDVEAEDFDGALDAAYEEIPDICGSCAGAWPGQKHSMDINRDGIESYLVTDESGEEVWKTSTYVESLSDTIRSLRKQIEKLEAREKAGN